MDRRHNYIIVVDTETANGFSTEDGKLDLTQSLCYDIGWQVADTKGRIYEKRSFVIAEIFCDLADVMKSAYYAEKIPQYWEDIKNGTRKLATFRTIVKQFREDAKNYQVEAIAAHNASFDYRALNNTQRYITKSKYRFFFPYGIEIQDTLKMARQTIGQMPTYIKWCFENGYVTKHKNPRPRLTAEILWRWLSGNDNFEESHTGLADCEIETQIYAYCIKKNPSIEKGLFKKAPKENEFLEHYSERWELA